MKNELLAEIGAKNYQSVLDALPLSAREIQNHFQYALAKQVSKGQATYLAAAFIHIAHTLGHIVINANTAIIEKLNIKSVPTEEVEVKEFTPTVYDFDPH